MVGLRKVEDRPTPACVYNFRVYMCSIVAALAAIMIGYDSAFIGGTIVLPSFEKEFGLNKKSTSEFNFISANIVSTYQGGWYVAPCLPSLSELSNAASQLFRCHFWLPDRVLYRTKAWSPHRITSVYNRHIYDAWCQRVARIKSDICWSCYCRNGHWVRKQPYSNLYIRGMNLSSSWTL
jgi:hypothetical protein